MSDNVTHWSEKAEWMRDAGAIEAAWSPEGQLTHLKLGPPASRDDSDGYDPVESRTPVERERHEREERRRITLGSSGGPVKRLGADD